MQSYRKSKVQKKKEAKPDSKAGRLVVIYSLEYIVFYTPPLVLLLLPNVLEHSRAL